MEDVRGLKELQLDALREVANIGAGHAATALSQMTNRTIMIAVPEVNVRPLEEVTDLIGRPDEVVAAVLMHMMGDLTGRTLVMFDEASARALCDILFRRSAGTTREFAPGHPTVSCPFCDLSNAQYREYVEDGGNPPRYWRKVEGVWMERRFNQIQALRSEEPVRHVDWNEKKPWLSWVQAVVENLTHWSRSGRSRPVATSRTRHSSQSEPPEERP